MMTQSFTVTLRNRNCTFTVAGDEFILEAAERAGITLPYGCRAGHCITCAARLVAGDVDQSEGDALRPYQNDGGYVLLCVAYPRADCVFDVGAESQAGLFSNPFKRGSDY